MRHYWTIHLGAMLNVIAIYLQCNLCFALKTNKICVDTTHFKIGRRAIRCPKEIRSQTCWDFRRGPPTLRNRNVWRTSPLKPSSFPRATCCSIVDHFVYGIWYLVYDMSSGSWGLMYYQENTQYMMHWVIHIIHHKSVMAFVSHFMSTFGLSLVSTINRGRSGSRLAINRGLSGRYIHVFEHFNVGWEPWTTHSRWRWAALHMEPIVTKESPIAPRVSCEVGKLEIYCSP